VIYAKKKLKKFLSLYHWMKIGKEYQEFIALNGVQNMTIAFTIEEKDP
jgi:hypothetical protein